MNGDERDRLGEKLHDKEQADEDRYFRERDRRLLERMKAAPVAAPAARDASEPAAMRCPRCGSRLERERLQVLGREVTAEACRACQGLWLDRAVLEQAMRGRQPGWLARCLRRVMQH
jgi:hypothetical protein